ncbi:MAG: c-type cytochrome [Vicinamibacterales bacterium]
MAQGKRILGWVVGLLLVLVIVAISAVGWQVILGPTARPVTDRKFESSSARLVRGEYLTDAAGCFHCHSDHDFTNEEYPILPGRKGAGWEMPIPELGSMVSRNITSDPETGLGNWTDDEIARAIQEGVSRDGSALFPVMPYMNFRNLDDEDLASIVVYLRTVPPVRQVRPKSKLIFPLSVLIKTMPKPMESHASVARTTPVARGEYLVRTVAGCQDCHSPAVQGTPVAGLDLAGGSKFNDPGQNMAPVHSRNITTDPSGIAHYDEGLFLQTLRTGQVPGRTLTHIMPFSGYRNLTDDDLRDIFAYLKSVPPVKHRVSNTDVKGLCPLCGETHGLGDKNAKLQ